MEQHWGLGASLALSLRAAPGFPDRYCDWQEAGYPQGNPSSRLGDPRYLLLLNSERNQAWQPPVGGWSWFPWQPSAASSWLGREGREEGQQKQQQEGLCEDATLGCWGKALMAPLFQIGDALSLRLDSHLCSIPFKGSTPLRGHSY